MKDRLIYFDNAATTWPKPAAVPAAVKNCVERYGGNPGRGSHPLAAKAGEILYSMRESAADFFGCDPERVIFTGSATQALNTAIRGMLKEGDHVLISGMSHNAVFRPVYAMAERGIITYDIYERKAWESDEEILAAVEEKLRPETAMVISTHLSNICSEREPVEKIGGLCRQRGIRFVVDGAQSAGHLPIDIRKMNIDALCVPGHKGLYGIQGCGMLLLGQNVDARSVKPLMEGGSGIHSLDERMPEDFPERLEAGTPPTPAIAGLLAGLDWVKQIGTGELHENSAALSSYLWNVMTSDPFYTVYGSGDEGLVSFTAEGYSPAEVGRYLAEQGICVRTGYHCAPLAHRSVGSIAEGTVRVSFSSMNSVREVNILLNLLSDLKRAAR